MSSFRAGQARALNIGMWKGVRDPVESQLINEHIAYSEQARQDEADLAARSRSAAGEYFAEEDDDEPSTSSSHGQHPNAATLEPLQAKPPFRPRGLLRHAFSIGGAQLDAASRGLNLSKPSCSIALPNGDLCVADTAADRLVVVSTTESSGSLRTTFDGSERGIGGGSDGGGEGAVKQPRGLACDATSLFVSEAGGSRVRKLRLPDELRVYGAQTPRDARLGGLLDPALLEDSTAQAALTFPQGLALSCGELFVCDCEEHCVAVYDATSLQYLRSFGGYGDEEGELLFPYGCAVVGEEVIVADVGNCRLSVFHRESGAFLRCLGEQGDEPGCFQNPRAVTTLALPDPNGPQGRGSSVLVTCEKHRVQVLSLQGEPLDVVEVPGAADLWSLCNLRGRICVTDKGRGTIHVLAPTGATLPASQMLPPPLPAPLEEAMSASSAPPIEDGGGMTAALGSSIRWLARRVAAGVTGGVAPGSDHAEDRAAGGGYDAV